MKKMFAFLLAAVMCISLTACGNDSEGKNDTENTPIVGGWTNTESPEVTKEVKALLEKATAELDGADYTPVAYLGTQVVAGTNHLLLCKVTPVVPDAVSTYALVTIYEDLKGEAKITEVQNNDAEAGVLDAPGGWQDTESLEVTKESLEALRLASQKLTGATYSPVALLGTQVVAGTNYRMLCTVTPVTPNAEPKYEIVVISVDVDMETGTLETYGFYTTEEEAGE